MKQFIIISFMLFLSNFCLIAQSKSDIAQIEVKQIGKTESIPYKNIKTDTLISVQFEGTPNVFPVFHSKNRPDVVDKINLTLQFINLSQIPGKYKNEDPFFISRNGDKCGARYFGSYEIRFIKPSLIQVSISYNHYYCTGVGDSWDYSTYLFSLVSGDLITFEDFFSESGLKSIKTKIISSFRNQFDDIIDQINLKSKEFSGNDSDKERFNAQLELYTKCKSYTDQSDFDYNNFSYQSDGIKVTRRYCWGNESERGLEDYSSPNFFISFEKNDLELSDYGRYILLLSEKVSYTTNLKSKILKGTIGDKYPIKAIITKVYDNGSVKMHYWYDKVGTPIKLRGKIIDDEVTLEEREYNEKLDKWIPNAVISAKIVDNIIIGTWTNSKTKKELKFELENY